MLGILVLYTVAVLYAVFFIAPPIEGLGYLARIAFFHIPVAWVAVLAFFLSAWWGFRYLKKQDLRYDDLSSEAARLGFIFVILATMSGAYFAHLTWGSWWNWDPRQTTIFVLLLIYSAYLVLRQSLREEEKRARISAIYSLFSCVTVPFLVFVIPRFYFSLHPTPVINSSGSLMMDSIFLWILLACVVDVTAIFFYFLLRKKNRSEGAAFLKGEME